MNRFFPLSLVELEIKKKKKGSRMIVCQSIDRSISYDADEDAAVVVFVVVTAVSPVPLTIFDVIRTKWNPFEKKPNFFYFSANLI